uniref:TSA: Wollemia nobilis Ref_Wollemi_Transcript_11722_1825 transcribed RNA sequence n=1 Tax=Wollemia nobilis TaxID=56998 RepID=A0A0C9S666_9CONI
MKMFITQFFLSLLLLAVGFLLLRFLTRKNAIRPSHPSYEGPAAYPIVGCALDYFKNRHRFLEWFTEILEKSSTNTVKLERPGGVIDIMTANPANVEHFLKTGFENYPKGERFRFTLHDFLGRGILNADGELWKMQRKTASYEFSTKSLRNFMVETVQWEIQNRLIPVLSNACRTGERMDLQDVLYRFAFDNICRVAFGVDPCYLLPSMPTSSFAQAFDDASDISAGRFFSAVPFLWRIKRLLNIGCERRLRQAIRVVDEFALHLVRSRRSEISSNGGLPTREDLLCRFIASFSNDSNPVSPQNCLEDKGEGMNLFLKDMVISFMLAGRDTTPTALTWFFWVLYFHPAVEEAIQSEILGVLERRKAPAVDVEGVVFSFEELREMQYLHAALCESMRLYPPVPVDAKAAIKDDVLPDGTCVGKGWYLTYINYSMGRMENIWGRDCLEFKPERWLKNGEFVGENPYKFPIFHAGPRICLGKDMAFIQMKSIVASVIHRFSFQVGRGDKFPEYMVSLTMRMKGGLPVTVRLR